MNNQIHIIISFFAITLSINAVSAKTIPPEAATFFENKIRPILAESCYECHNSINKRKAGLALDWRGALLRGSDDGAVIIPGDPDKSLLIQSIRHDDEGLEMPSKAPKLPDHVIKDFEDWVKMGAPDPRQKKPTQADLDKSVPWPELLKKRKAWWSFQPLKKTEPPTVSDAVWHNNPIDRYLFSAIEKEGLHPVGVASPEVLVRRLHLMLTGLPPKPNIVKAFVANPSASVYEALVDDLLASDAYAERWARYWMDWYRYAESHGSEADPIIPYASVYRDYVIRAFKQDVPYDQLLREHIAGDLLKHPRINKKLGIVESAIGPAHIRLSPHGYGVVDTYAEQISFVDNQVDVISKAMLGLTVSCARCHNHKFDPISHKDFYRFYGIMVSNRLTTINVDTPEKQAMHKETLFALKDEIKAALSVYWLKEVEGAVGKLVAYDIHKIPRSAQVIQNEGIAQAKNKLTRLQTKVDVDKENGLDVDTEAIKAAEKELQKAKKKKIQLSPSEQQIVSQHQEVNQSKRFHPFSWMNTLSDLPVDKFDANVKIIYNEYLQIKKEVATKKKQATFYADLTNQETVDQWYLNGNGLSPTVSRAGIFAVAADGSTSAILGIYPGGIYSHLFSDKHSATISSIYHYAKGEKAYVHTVGNDGSLRMVVRNYPRSDGGLHPTIEPHNDFMRWSELKKYKFWNGEKVHFEFTTSKDRSIKTGPTRSWFGVSELVAGVDGPIAILGAPLNAVFDQCENIKDKQALITAYQKALQDAIIAWQTNKMDDAQAQFLSAFVRFDFLSNTYGKFPEQINTLFERYRKLEAEIPEPTRAPGLVEGDVVDQPLLGRGNYHDEEAPVSRGFLELFSEIVYSKENSGRLALAKDMVSPENTLKSRLVVNRLWNYLFGAGIVASTDNFGRMGKKPTHPELLDYLAINFEKNGWSIKKAIKQMVLSRAFRGSSDAPLKLTENDPENKYLSYYMPRRLDAEAIKDSINSVTGEHYERAIYTSMRRNSLDPFLTTFNLPLPTSTRSKRDITNVPAQALSLLNGKLVKAAAEKWAVRIRNDKSFPDAASKIDALFIDAYARKATKSEHQQMIAFYHSIEESHNALKQLAFTILNSKEFIYVY